jgi:23S rRNA pseudouridine955/2504/2580 synthase
VSVDKVTVAEADDGLRLDRWFRRHYPHLTHGRLEKLLRRGEIRVDGGRVRAGHRLAAGMVVRVPPLPPAEGPPPAAAPPSVSAADAEDLRARVLHRDDMILVIDKPAGLAVQGGSGTARHLDGMLDALRFDADERPRLVHRLDRDTSGVLVLARTRKAAAAVGEAFQDRAARKLYWALVHGTPDTPVGRWDTFMEKKPGGRGEQVSSGADGKRAVTLYRVLGRSDSAYAWLALTPLTGRTHQLRVHCAEAGLPIVGDPRYGDRRDRPAAGTLGKGLHLHARALEMPHPAGGILRANAPLPPHMEQSWRFLGFAPDAEPTWPDD